LTRRAPPCEGGPMRVGRKAFERIVEKAISRIPGEIRQHLENVIVTVEKRPSPELLEDMGLPPDYPLLGVYQGVELPERSATFPPLYPDTIYIFQEPLEDICDPLAVLEEEIEITVVHEVAHMVGISEERLAELGYG